MAHQLNKLSAKEVKNAIGSGKIRKLADGGGLTLVIKGESKYWWLRYRFAGNEKTLSLGSYPQISLAAARQARDKARELLQQKIDPSALKQRESTQRVSDGENTFRTLCEDWYQQKHCVEVTEAHAVRNWRRLEIYTFPMLARRPIRSIQPTDILQVLDGIIKKGNIETAHRVKTLISLVFRYAVATSRVDSDVTRDLTGYLPKTQVKHQPALVRPEEVSQLLKDIHAYHGHFATSAALRLSPLVFTRPGDTRQMLWEQIDFNKAQWELPTTKNGAPLIVPLAEQAILILREVEPVTMHRSRYVFPNARDAKRPMSNVAIKAALDRMGYGGKMTAHGFRAAARTLLQEELKYPVHLIEMQLGHRVADMHGRAYNRTEFIEDRRQMMQTWATYLEKLRTTQ
ncbi:integrase arm-type DNA-binding domain-containing protein [Marinobacter sp. M3C]|uniref:tyrosine-type recombinase/integrase n=1 Tax=unclassified Marinobacter TaxID=83889 RepID=UPI00200D2679|nr:MULTISPECIES: integrase arm-type DNA-binding domain-containing protein [unclassified Marinobacter]MCL1487289.1 integrase arm-type DNA-binding domain-containing protein [Marinobacter sp.]UQG55523.1 integrase arm-type DNA-binding domain-containing protein [Marinobacter sp. M4C]UQG59160.1 integrase arm-type DNA-binding domain-containing protein [Marinobacter sp. M3C]UQG64327.1 integrase arm-type DNA-binding domain-containing protein [Marinobacter sp. M2C]UQG68606.1 integrase arm-type DNA-bindi